MMLPKFLLADNSQASINTIYVVHTQSPRFIIQSDIEDFQKDQKIHWIDDQPESAELIQEMIEAAENFLEDELQHQEELFDQEDE